MDFRRRPTLILRAPGRWRVPEDSRLPGHHRACLGGRGSASGIRGSSAGDFDRSALVGVCSCFRLGKTFWFRLKTFDRGTFLRPL